MKFTIITFLILFTVGALAQPELDIKPNRIEFEDLFNRFDYAFLINKGDEILTIDSIAYNDSIYIVDYEGNLHLPFSILPDDSVRMNVLLSAFYQVTLNDTSDTMYVYNNGISSPEPLEVRIRFFEDEFGEINGEVKDSLSMVDSATVYFFYNGIYLLDTAMTNSAGYYTKTLPAGTYTLGVEKKGYYVVFHDSTYDPFFAEFVQLDSGDVKTIDFNLKRVDNNNLSVGGQIVDSINGINVNKGIIIVRTGTHVPTPKIQMNQIVADTINVFAGFVKEDGSYLVNVQLPDYYYLQAYTNNFLPGFYNDGGVPSVYWQNADSVLINDNIIDKNISLARDSSYGAGSIGGFITFSTPSDESNYEGITILAKKINNGALYSYNFGKELGNFSVANIPYGTYELVAQKIGLDNAISQTVVIDPVNNQITGINLNFIISTIESDVLIPSNIVLYQNYPNPFNPTTNITFTITSQSFVSLKVYDLLGNELATLVNEEKPTGTYEVKFNGSKFTSGVYFYNLQVGQSTKIRKMVLIK
jgi:hypothetical protein